MNTATITLTLDEVDTVREALMDLMNKYSEQAEEAYDKDRDKLAEAFEEEARKVYWLINDKFYMEHERK